MKKFLVRHEFHGTIDREIEAKNEKHTRTKMLDEVVESGEYMDAYWGEPIIVKEINKCFKQED